jgi:hypothetical protein
MLTRASRTVVTDDTAEFGRVKVYSLFSGQVDDIERRLSAPRRRRG